MREQENPMAIVRPNDRDAQPPPIGNGHGSLTTGRFHATEHPVVSCEQTGAWATCPFRVGAKDAPNRAPVSHPAVPRGFDETILALFRRGMTVREIGVFLREQRRMNVSEAAIRAVTESAIEPLEEWQSRHLDRMYPIVFFLALPVKIREDGAVKHKSAHVAFGVAGDGRRNELGIWIGENDEAVWQRVTGDLRARGVEDILIVALDGLNGSPEAIAQAFPNAHAQTCFLHLFRFSLGFCVFNERLLVDRELKKIFQCECPESALKMLGEFERSALGQKYPMIARSWKDNWTAVVPFFGWSQEIRRLFYLTKTIDGPRAELLKAIKGVFLGDEAATQQIHLALRGVIKKKKRGSVRWKATALQFAIRFGKRFTGEPDGAPD